MLPELYLGLHMDALLKSNREFGFLFGSRLTANSVAGFQLTAANIEEKFDSKTYDVNCRLNTFFYRYNLGKGWYFDVNLINREAHEKLGIESDGILNGDVVEIFKDRIDIDAESYLAGADVGYEFTLGQNFFIDITAITYAVPVVTRSWATLDSRVQQFQDKADRFAKKIAENSEAGAVKISFGMAF